MGVFWAGGLKPHLMRCHSHVFVDAMIQRQYVVLSIEDRIVGTSVRLFANGMPVCLSYGYLL
jgi:hypothetical protein